MTLLDQMPNAEPVLQIVHLSDMHVVSTNNAPAAAIRQWVRRFRRAGLSAAADMLEDGAAPNDTSAPRMLEQFLPRLVQDPKWRGCPTWLIDTGDHTTFGDTASLVTARAHLASFSAALGTQTQSCPSLQDLPGNHDAWPETFPVLAPRKIQAQVVKLHSPPHAYRIGCASDPLVAALPGGGEIQLYTLDTVDHRFAQNALARGAVSDAQYDELDGLIGQRATGGHDLRILAAHHPMQHPPPRPSLLMVLADPHRTELRLNRPPPCVHLVLGGHTHALYPEHSKLPASPRRQAPNDPLGLDQCQLVIGTLMQEDGFGKRGADPHQVQVLRFFQDPGVPSSVLLQRGLVARNPYANNPRFAYDFVKLPNGGTFEEMMLAL